MNNNNSVMNIFTMCLKMFELWRFESKDAIIVKDNVKCVMKIFAMCLYHLNFGHKDEQVANTYELETLISFS